LLVAGVGACVLLLATAVVGLAGGFDSVPAEELPVVAADEVFESEPWHVTVDGAALAADLEPAVLYEDGYWLAVIADVEITTDESWDRSFEEILYVTGVDGMAREHQERSNYPGGILADDIRLVRDGSAVGALHPGLPERLAFLWELAIDTPPPTEVRVEITGREYIESSLNGQMEWLREEPRAQLTLPVQDRREADEET
jgi:hypothetical protein